MQQKFYPFSSLENNKIKLQVLLLASHRRVPKFSIMLISMTCLDRNCPVTLLGWTSISTASLIQARYLDLIKRILMFQSWMQCPKSMLCPTKPNLSRWTRHTCWWCSFILVLIQQPVCPTQTWPHPQGIPYTSGVFNHISSLNSQRKLDIPQQDILWSFATTARFPPTASILTDGT